MTPFPEAPSGSTQDAADPSRDTTIQVRGYDQLALCYKPIEFLVFGRALERARFHHFAQLRDCQRILLLGDGDGRGLKHICRIAPHAQIDSVDISAGMLRHAEQRLTSEERARVNLRQADALTTTFPADTYDAVTTLFFLDCFSNDQVEQLIELLLPALKPGALWLHADFQLPRRGWQRLRAQCRLKLMLMFFRWQTGLAVRGLPESFQLLKSAGLTLRSESTWQGGFIHSASLVLKRQP